MWAAIVLGVIGIVAAGLLYVVARRFSVDDDPRIDQVEGLLPGANCGGCGFSGCRAFAQACCNATSLEGLSCPGSDRSTMGRIASALGLQNESCPDVRKVATVGCGAKCGGRQAVALYDGPASCVAVAAIGSGESLCSYGCVGMGDCVGVCPFDAISVNSETKIPEVDHSRCTGCGAVCGALSSVGDQYPSGEGAGSVYVCGMFECFAWPAGCESLPVGLYSLWQV